MGGPARRLGVAVISNPAVCDICVFESTMFSETKLIAVLCLLSVSPAVLPLSELNSAVSSLFLKNTSLYDLSLTFVQYLFSICEYIGKDSQVHLQCVLTANPKHVEK